MIEELQQAINDRLSEFEDEILENRIDYMLDNDGFLNRFRSAYLKAYKPMDDPADNPKQVIKNFLMEEMDVNG